MPHWVVSAWRLACVGLVAAVVATQGEAQTPPSDDPHLRWGADASVEPSADRRFHYCNLARALGDSVIAPQRVKDWVVTAFFAPLHRVEWLVQQKPAQAAREDLYAWMRDAQVEQGAAVRLLRGTRPASQTADIALWRVPLRVVAPERAERGFVRADFVSYLRQGEGPGRLDSLGRQMLAATLARVTFPSAKQRHDCTRQWCELRVLVGPIKAVAGGADEVRLLDVQLWSLEQTADGRDALDDARAQLLSAPNLDADGQEVQTAAELYLQAQAKALECEVPAPLRR